jgi:hypothetical protein
LEDGFLTRYQIWDFWRVLARLAVGSEEGKRGLADRGVEADIAQKDCANMVILELYEFVRED